MVYALHDLKIFTQNELISFFSKLLQELGVDSYSALQTLNDLEPTLALLKSLGLGIDDKSSNDASLLHYAASAGLISVVDALLSMGYANTKTKIGAGLGHYAAQSGHVELIQHLFQKGLLDLHEKDNHGAGFILYAAYRGHVEAVKSLINLGLEQDETNNEGASVIHYALLGGGATSQIENWIELGYNPHAVDKYGNAALHFAARLGKAPILNLLIEKYGSNPETKNYKEESIFDLALQNQGEEIIDLCSKKAHLKHLYENYLIRGSL